MLKNRGNQQKGTVYFAVKLRFGYEIGRDW